MNEVTQKRKMMMEALNTEQKTRALRIAVLNDEYHSIISRDPHLKALVKERAELSETYARKNVAMREICGDIMGIQPKHLGQIPLKTLKTLARLYEGEELDEVE